MPHASKRAHEIRQLWRHHRIVVVEGPSGSGRSAAAAAALNAALEEGARATLVVEGRRVIDVDDLRLWVATGLAAQRAKGREPSRRHALVDDLHLLDDESWAMIERLAADQGTRWVLTIAKGRAPERLSRLKAEGAAVVALGPVDTESAARIIAEVWGREAAPGVVDVTHELTAGRAGWIRRLATITATAAPQVTTSSRSEAATYEWGVFPRLAASLGDDLGLGDDAVEALRAVWRGDADERQRHLSLALGEASPDPYSDAVVITVPLLRRLLVPHLSARQVLPLGAPAIVRGRRWLDMCLPLGALEALEGTEGLGPQVLRAEALAFAGRIDEARVLLTEILGDAEALATEDLTRVVAVGLACESGDALARAFPSGEVAILLDGLRLAKDGDLAGAREALEIGNGAETEPGEAGMAPLRRGLCAWYAALGDDTVAAYRTMFSVSPSTGPRRRPVSPLWEALLGDVHAATCLVLGEWNRAGVVPAAFPERSNAWLRNDHDAWPIVAAIMARPLGLTPVTRSVFASSVVGLPWLHGLARVGGRLTEATTPAELALVRTPEEPGLRRLLSICRARAELHTTGQGLRGGDQEEKQATAVGSTLARVQLALWGLAADATQDRANAAKQLDRLCTVYGLTGWVHPPQVEVEEESPLSTREREVCRELALGYTAGETAKRLGISPRTVEKHAGNAYKKLGITTRSELAEVLGLSEGRTRVSS